jgi:hydroxypyruvate isomerase
MPKFASCLMMMFTEHKLPDRIAAAADVGFTGVEIQRPYDQDLDDLATKLDRAGVECTLLNTPYGPDEATKFGRAAIPGQEAAFLDDLTLAMDSADALGCTRIHVMSGTMPAGANPADHRATLVSNMREASDRAAERGITLHLEPLNHTDNPAYFLVGQAMGHSIADEVARDNVKVQFDLYHTQMAEGFVSDKIENYLAKSAYIQFAGVPGRNEPDHGEMNHPFLFDMIEAAGYDGWLGAEYKPRAGTLEGLGWAKPYGIG